MLEAAGFEAYEVSNHARGEAARSRHNLVYWRGGDYVGVGPGAHGRLTVNGARIATAAARRIDAYLTSVAFSGVGWAEEAALTAREMAEERLLMGLRTVLGAPYSELAALGLTAESPAVRTFTERGLLAGSADRLTATAAGRLVLDRLTAELAVA